MPFTNSDYLPSYEELTVQEIELTAAPMRAAAHHLGKYCDNQCKEFMLCFKEEKDPRKCLNEGKEVTRCGIDFFQKIKATCAVEYTSYWNCIDHSQFDMHFRNCRPSQAVFDKCVFDKLAQSRPEPGYFAKARLHHTNRPRPQRVIPMPEPLPGPPEMDKDPEAPESVKKYGSRFFSWP